MKFISYFLTSLLLISVTSFTYFDETEYNPIITRHDVDESEFQKLALGFEKYMCHLNLPDCEGTIIADHWAISAAHCSIEIQNKLKEGKKHFVIINGEEIEIVKVIIHKKWKRDEAYDIALLYLKDKQKKAVNAKLYIDEDEVGKVVYLVGKGDKGNGLNGIEGNDGILRAATNRVEEATDYWLKWIFDSPDSLNENFTEYEGISGPGDSGGPAFIIKDGIVCIAGISSGQSTKNSGGIEGLYGVREYYVRISQYQDWISKEINKTVANN